MRSSKKSKPLTDDDIITLRMTRKRALSFGLLLCECGYPTNNHFGYTGACAHNSTCKQYKERARFGVEIVKRRVGRAV